MGWGIGIPSCVGWLNGIRIVRMLLHDDDVDSESTKRS